MAAPTYPVMSFNGKAYYNAGSYASPTWTLVNNIGEIGVVDAMDWNDVPLRSNGGFKAGIPGLRDIGFTWKMIYNPADTGQSAMRTAYRARSGMEFLFLDQAVATAGSAGVRATYAFTKFARMEEDGKPMMVDVEIKPYAAAAQAPEDYTSS